MSTYSENILFSNRVLNTLQVSKLTTLSKSTIYRMVKREAFPSPIQLSGNRSGFIAKEVENWISTRTKIATTKAASNSSTNSTPMNTAIHTSYTIGMHHEYK